MPQGGYAPNSKRSHEGARRFVIRRLLDPYRQSQGARASALMVAAVAGASVGGYLFNLVAIRWLGAPGYGEVAALTSLTLLVLLPLVSIQNAVGRDVAHLLATAREARVTAHFHRWLARMLGLGLLLGGATVLATGPIQDRLGIESATSVWLTAAAIAVSTVLPVTQGVLQGLQRFRWLAASTLAFALVRPLLAPPLILLGGVSGAMAATAIAAVVPVAITGLGIRRALSRLETTLQDVADDHSTMLWPALLGVTGFTVLTNIDVVVAKATLSAQEAGNYASAALVGKAVLFAAAGITAVLLPRMTTYLFSDRGAITSAVRRSLLTVALLGVAFAAVLAPLPESFVLWLFGPSFGDARELLAPFALAMTVAAVAQVLLTIALAAGDRRYPAVLAVVAAVDVTALSVFNASSQMILVVTAVSCTVAVAAYEAVAGLPLRRVLRRAYAVGTGPTAPA
jgi:O-antigen/teichoic acid export membrane protein